MEMKLLKLKKDAIVLHARFFSEIVRKLPTDTVEIEVQEQFTNDYSFRKS